MIKAKEESHSVKLKKKCPVTQKILHVIVLCILFFEELTNNLQKICLIIQATGHLRCDRCHRVEAEQIEKNRCRSYYLFRLMNYSLSQIGLEKSINTAALGFLPLKMSG